MSLWRVLGLIVFIVGVVLLIFGINATQKVSEKVMEGTTGRYTHETMWYIIGGIVLIIGGLTLTAKRRLK
jgi:uncharacterized membrane protein YidH (DUF202 family)